MSRKLAVENIKENLLAHFNQMVEDYKHLYQVHMDKDEFWELFQNAIPEEENKIFRERRTWDCQCCKHFFNRMGNVVAVNDDYQIISIWDFFPDDPNWEPIVKKLSDYIHSCGDIVDIYVSDEKVVGTPVTRVKFDESDNIFEFHHFSLPTPDEAYFKPRYSESKESRKAEVRDRKNVLKRTLEEVTLESVEDVLDLIGSNNLYRGEENKEILVALKEIMEEYKELDDEVKDSYTWWKAYNMNDALAKVRNHAIGTLLVNISEGMELEEAVKKYEVIVAPQNYKRPNPIFTKAMIERAKETIRDLGLENSLGRRFAILDDITVNNILFANRDAAKRIQGGDQLDDIFGDLEKHATASKPMNFERTPEIPIAQFIQEVIPEAQSIEAYFENRHRSQMVSLIAPSDKNATSITKWNNNFGWAYNGNIADSAMKENVKALGGKVEGDLRFSIQWNDDPNYINNNDYDAHCVEEYLCQRGQRKHEIYFSNKGQLSPNKGMLDVDIIEPIRDLPHGQPAVENIIYEDRKFMSDGVYHFFVHVYTDRRGQNGLSAEIEFDGCIHHYEIRNPIVNANHIIPIADVILKDGKFTIKEYASSEASSKDIWDLKTNNFIPVTTVMYSPNYWDEQEGIGNRHYFFMLDGCKNPDTPNGFYNEFLRNDLHDHRKVFEALGSKMKVNPSDNQLSGIGFSSTRRNDLVVKVLMRDNSEKVLKIKF